MTIYSGKGEQCYSKIITIINKTQQKIFEEIMVENFPNLMKNINLQTREVQYTTIQINQRKWHIRSLSQISENQLQKEMQSYKKDSKILRIITDLSLETVQSRN